MLNRKNRINLLYIFIYIVIAAVGLNNSLGISKGQFQPPIFYTSVSGLICFIYFLIAFVRGIYAIIFKKELTKLFIFPRLKGAITMCITVTFLMYHFMVYDGPIFSIDLDIYNVITHYFVPVAVIVNWLIFDEKGKFKLIDPLLWTLIPMAYFAWANFVALQHTVVPYWDGDFYPYGFMDLTIHSKSQVMGTVVIVFILFVMLGYLIYLLDNKLARQLNTK